jgi:hypothetical protein
MRKAFLFVFLALFLLSSSIYLSVQAWHLSPGETVAIKPDASANPPRSDLGLLLRKGPYSVQLCCPHSMEVVKDLPGAHGPALRFEVRNTDSLVRGSFRAEGRLRPNHLHSEFWYQARILVPADWKPSATPVVAMQWHNTRDFFLGEVGAIPPLALDIVGSQWRVIRAWDRRWISPETPPRVEGHQLAATAPLEPGKWSEWTFHVRWSPNSDGFLRVWKDGQLLVEIEGPIGYQDLIGPYLKFGVYVPGWKDIGLEKDVTTRVLYFDLIAASASPANLPLAFTGS